MKNNIVVFDTESKARKTCEWLNNFMKGEYILIRGNGDRYIRIYHD